MALTGSTVKFSIQRSILNSVVAGANPVKITDALTFTNSPAVATYNRDLRKRYTVAAAGTQVIDLASFTDDFNAGAAVVLTRAAGIMIKGTQAFRIEPNAAANPLPWIWGIAANYMTFGADEGFCAFKAVTFTTGSRLLLTNQGALSGTFDVLIIGGT